MIIKAIKQIAEQGRINDALWHAMTETARADMVRNYFSHDRQRWNQVKAQYEVEYASRNGWAPHCTTPG